MNSIALDRRSPHWAPSFPWQRRRPQGKASPPEAAAVRPSCRLLLEGGKEQEDPCDLLALSSEGVTIVLKEARAVRRGQQGQLLIGPAGGPRYSVPVAVRGVKPSVKTAVVELTFPPTERWSYSPA